jgi:hypothetical protein
MVFWVIKPYKLLVVANISEKYTDPIVKVKIYRQYELAKVL